MSRERVEAQEIGTIQQGKEIVLRRLNIDSVDGGGILIWQLTWNENTINVKVFPQR